MTSTALAASGHSAQAPTGAAPTQATEAGAALTDLLAQGRAQGHLSLSELRTAFSAAGVTSSDGRSILRELTDNGVRLANGGEDSAMVADPDAEDDVLENTLIATVPDTDEAPKAASGKVASRKGPSTRRKARSTRRAKKTETTQATTDPETGEADLDDQSPAMGDSVHTYLKAIGRRQLLTAEQEVDLAKRVEAGLYAEYRLGQHGQIDETAEMAEVEREELEWVAEDGRKAKSHMLEANLRLVVSVAKKYSDRGMSLLDVVQEGNLGLIRAVEKFDYTKGFKFSTYAMWWIRQAIQRGFADSARTIRLPVHVLELLSKVSRLERDMHQALGREPTPEELGLELDKTPAQIEELLRVTRQPISLDSTIGEDGETRIGDLIEDVDASEASEVVDRQLMADQLRNALSDLEPREATIMSLRFGLMDGRPRTLDEIGKHLGLTRERIRQLEKQSLSKLRHPSRAQQLLDFAS
ncbi:RNA polymerase sigma factor [Nocardiopsis sp. MG754419]|uniref:RNA polymerase sigma factor n=1 Tax=Nocardiopsis sp. MG754419 TaxID=2259865 RepID=UPI001BA99A4E|nr:RNA polymerase sigma factor [Nocardiopsis sp. MG754419]MBR8740874.1 RNA polymerase sigma factor [Nocardiopsis sp. MG754419]